MPLFQRPAIGLDISDHSIEAVFVVRKGDRPVLASYGRTTLQPGIVTDGFVERRNELAQILRKLLADQMTPPIPRGAARVVFGLSDSQVYSHIFEVPRQADEVELAKSLATEADGFFPYNHQEVFPASVTIGLRPDKKDVYYTAAHKETIKGFLALFGAAGLEPAAIEPESAAIARAILLPGEPDPVLFIDIGAKVTNLTVFDRNGAQFAETLDTAGDAFTAALMRGMNIPMEDAESLKRNQGLSQELDQKAQRALRGEIDRLVVDIREAVTFYESRTKRLIKRIVACGGSVQMPGMLEYLAAKLPTPERTFRIEAADPWLGIEVDPVLEKLGVRTRGTLITTAIGLGLRGAGFQKFSEINFLDSAQAELSASRPKTAFRPFARAATAVPTIPAFAAPGGSKKPLSRSLKVGLGLVAVLGLAALIWALVFVAVPRLRSGPAGAPELAAPPAVQPGEIALEAEAAVGNEFSAKNGLLTAEIVEAEILIEQTVPHEAETVVGTASGEVRLVNDGPRGQTLVARTRLLSEGGVLFRLDERVFVPAGGSVTARVTADAQGAEGDVPAGRFTIPGLAAAVQEQVYGESDAAMRGGTVVSGPPVTAAELEAAAKAVGAGKSEQLLAAIAAKAGAESMVLRESITVDGAVMQRGPEVGKPSATFTMTVAVRGRAVAVAKSQASELMQEALNRIAAQDPDLLVEKYAIDDLSLSVVSVGAEKETAVVTIRAKAKLKQE